jgi:hypothetical protein
MSIGAANMFSNGSNSTKRLETDPEKIKGK